MENDTLNSLTVEEISEYLRKRFYKNPINFIIEETLHTLAAVCTQEASIEGLKFKLELLNRLEYLMTYLDTGNNCHDYEKAYTDITKKDLNQLCQVAQDEACKVFNTVKQDIDVSINDPDVNLKDDTEAEQ